MDKEKDHPKVFISHASEDKDRFVIGFAEKLRAKGIDAWLDKWEMLLGDNLVKKIFDEGIKESEFVIVILSNNSINKQCVVEKEMYVSVVMDIEKRCKLIPIRIDDCEVPVCLKEKVRISIKDLNNYEDEFDRIVSSIYGLTDKPPVGDIPKYAQNEIDIILDLKKPDSLIIKASCEKVIETNNPEIQTEDIYEQLKQSDIPKNEYYDSLEVLNNRGYIKLVKALGGHIPSFSITYSGFEEYATTYIPSYDALRRKVGLQIVNDKQMDSESISKALNKPIKVINHIFESFELDRYLKLIPQTCGRINRSIMPVNRNMPVYPEFVRWLQET